MNINLLKPCILIFFNSYKKTIKINENQSISIRDHYDYPSDYPILGSWPALASSEEKKPGYSPGNKVEIELPALEKEFN